MARDKIIEVKFMTEKRVEHGEDAPPLSIGNETTCAVGVFDGMGGAGAAICKSDFGDNHTKAYVASRIIANAIHVYLDNHLSTNDVSGEDMKIVIQKRIKQELENYPPETKSILRSKLVRDYPTTLALITLQDKGELWQIDSYWAGDSHCYLWTKDGFFQISKDDLEEDNDPMENLHNDSPISNCVCADRDFCIHHKPIELTKEPIIILCATDGCFGYYPTPMHFEYVLKNCLLHAKSEEDWGKMIENEISRVTGDDCSLSLIAKGFSSFGELKKSMKQSPVIGFPQIVEQEQTIAWIEQELIKEKKQYEQKMSTGWENYKESYMKYLNEENNANA